jgi:Cu+-exporting ATPase
VPAVTNTEKALKHVDLAVSGMTCASCSARIEKRLNRIDGVAATVNFATETASVDFDPERTDPDELVSAVASIGYGATLPRTEIGEPPVTAADPVVRDLRQRLIGSAILAIPVLALSMIPALQFTNWQWLAFTLASPVVTWGAWPFHRAMLANLRHGAATMDTLVSMGVLAAYGWSVWALFWGDAGVPGMTMTFSLWSSADSTEHLYLEVASALTVFILTGRYLEARARRQAGAALRALLELGAKDATMIEADGTERRIPIAELKVGERFVTRPGEKVATDGVVEDGASAVDMAMLTGESAPVEVGPGDAVTGATMNVGGRLVVRATRVGADTALAHITRLVADAQAAKAPVQRLADRIAAVFVPAVIVLALATLAAWLAITGNTSAAFSAAVAVLIIACPCALGLATPMALLVGTGRGAQLGILIRGPEVLESTRRVDTVVLDKTGTITTGAMQLVDLVAAEGVTEGELLRLVGALEHASEHPIAGAIAAAAARRAPLAKVSGFTSHAGLGVEGTVDGLTVIAGRPAFLAERGMPLPSGLADAAAEAEAKGYSVVAAAWDGSPGGILMVADAVKPTSAEAVRQLLHLGLRPVLVTGDNAATAQTVAAEVGISEVLAGVLPAAKLDAVKRMQDDGHVVAMVGDGVNDAAALAQADLGIAMGSGTDAAIEASDLTLVRGDLRSAADAIRLARHTLTTIKGNLFWAFAYNIAALPLAALGLLNPLIAGAAMAGSSFFVVTNSLRLRRFQPATTNDTVS